jgi:spore coat protein U-like protein
MKRWAFLILLVLLAAVASADPKTARLEISARLTPAVTISTTCLDFGTLRKCDKDLKATATITVQARAGLPYAITLDAGQHYCGGSSRNVENSRFRIPYKIQDPTRRYLWGDKGYANTFRDGSAVRSTGNGKPQAFTAYGTLSTKDLKSSYPGGLYSDCVMVTIYY